MLKNPRESAALRRSGLIVGVLALACTPARAQVPEEGNPTPARPFPMDIVGREVTGGEESTLLAPRTRDLIELDSHDEVLLVGTPTTDGGQVTLRLNRVPSVLADGALHVDGVPRPFDQEAASLTLWRGVVEGEPDSDVMLAFSPYGCRGWIRRSGALDHLLAGPGPEGRWENSRSRLVEEQALGRLGYGLGDFCGVQRSDERLRVAEPESHEHEHDPKAALGPVLQPILTCRLAFETDFQLFQVFGNVTAETVYLTTLLSAVSAQYQSQISSILQVVYLMVYTSPNDPWNTPDVPGTTFAMLTEFQTAWANNLPNGAHLAHFGSGVSTWGGIAFVGALCDPQFGFGVSGGLTGATPFPLVQGPLNWDFYVTAHELGHNYGTWHTHDYCPVIDSCAPTNLMGICQPGTTCVTTGTIMSYCHLCPGGVSNITPVFHPSVASFMRMTALWSCL